MSDKHSEELFQSRNKNHTFTLISRDCIGGVLYHQLGLKFLTPTIDLFFTPDDFNRFCLNLQDYISGKLIELKDSGVLYPVGMLYPSKDHSLKPLRVDFMHYKSFLEAFNKWEKRKKRINWNNIYVISSFCYIGETKTYKPELVSEWNKIKYKKVLFVDKSYGFDDEIIMSKPKECEEYAWLLYKIDNDWKRVFNEFDFIKFLNE